MTITAKHCEEGEATNIALLVIVGLEVDAVSEGDDSDVKNPDDDGWVVTELNGGRDVKRVPMVIVVVSVPAEVVCDGMGMEDVAAGTGEANEPDMPSSLHRG